MKDLLTTYWVQTAFFFAGIGVLIFYLIKRHYDLKSKKTEIKFNLFFEKKILGICQFVEKTSEFLSILYKSIENIKSINFSALDTYYNDLSLLFFKIAIYLRIAEREDYNEVLKKLEKYYELFKLITKRIDKQGNYEESQMAEMLEAAGEVQNSIDTISEKLQKEVEY